MCCRGHILGPHRRAVSVGATTAGASTAFAMLWPQAFTAFAMLSPSPPSCDLHVATAVTALPPPSPTLVSLLVTTFWENKTCSYTQVAPLVPVAIAPVVPAATRPTADALPLSLVDRSWAPPLVPVVSTAYPPWAQLGPAFRTFLRQVGPSRSSPPSPSRWLLLHGPSCHSPPC
jgi:hypothetical protein